MNPAETTFVSDLTEVPVVDVTTDNIDTQLPVIKQAIRDASVIALDLELSGLGDRKKLRAQDMTERYDHMARVAMTRSIISLGVSTFKQDEADPAAFACKTFNVVVLCQEDYIVEPASLQFLVRHGFDFVKQYSKGLPYYRGNDRADSSSCVRDIFSEIIRSQKPVVLHNGHIDLTFLYQNLYAQLPKSVNSFTSELHEMFPGGLFDTKYMADYVIRMDASFLEFMFKHLQVKNFDRNTFQQPHLKLSFEDSATVCKAAVEYRDCRLKFDAVADDVKPCDSYSSHGHCPDGPGCSNSHDINVIFALKEKKRKRKRVPTDIDSEEPVQKSQKVVTSGGHRAGFDAFMTGYSFLSHLVHSTKKADLATMLSPGSNAAMSELKNKVHLSYKTKPLVVFKSSFAKVSQAHATKLASINATTEKQSSTGDGFYFIS